MNHLPHWPVIAQEIVFAPRVEESWIKSPMRFIEGVVVKDPQSEGLAQGLKIISNTEPEQDECDPWIVIDDE